jgi:hypothetical protein
MMQFRSARARNPNLLAQTAVVNLHVALYVLTSGALIGAGIQYARGKRTSARHLLWLGILGAGVSILLYWFFRPPI